MLKYTHKVMSGAQRTLQEVPTHVVPSSSFRIGAKRTVQEVSSQPLSSPIFTIGAKREIPEVASSPFVIGARREIQYTTSPNSIFSVDNVATQQPVSSFVIGVKRYNYNEVNEMLTRLKSRGRVLETPETIAQVIKDFKTLTGLNLHIPTTNNLERMNTSLHSLYEQCQKGVFPKEIKHVILSHGKRSSAEGNWVFEQTGESVFDYIRRHPDIKPGEDVLVGVCEIGKRDPNKFTVGRTVWNGFWKADEPAKIVKAGSNEISGHYLIENGIGTITRY